MNWLQTYSGRRFHLDEPRVEAVDIADIAHALSQLNRYGGHTLFPYSVAQHSVLVSEVVPEEYALWGLLHDAHEAYLGDVIRPVQRTLFKGALKLEFDEITHRFYKLIANAFGLLDPSPPFEVKEADLRILTDERECVMAPMAAAASEWGNLGPGYGLDIREMSPTQARKAFLRRFKELT